MSGISHSYNVAHSSGMSYATDPSWHQAGGAHETGQSFAAASARFESAVMNSPACDSSSQCYIVSSDGPGVTTLSLGEEDGNGDYFARPVLDGHTLMQPEPVSDYAGGMDVTTLAIGEEDGGQSYASGGQSYISSASHVSYDAHSVIGNPAPSPAYVSVGSLAEAAPSSAPVASSYFSTSVETDIGSDYMGGSYVAYDDGLAHTSESYISDDAYIADDGFVDYVARGDYGTMQPIYSPGDPEYSAYAEASTGPDLLNFSYVEPVPKPAVARSHDVVDAGSVASAPAVDSSAYVSVGSYESYVSGSTSYVSGDAHSVSADIGYVSDSSDGGIAMEAASTTGGSYVTIEDGAANSNASEPDYSGDQWESVGSLDEWTSGTVGSNTGAYEMYEIEPSELYSDFAGEGSVVEIVDDVSSESGASGEAVMKDEDLRITTLAVGEEDGGTSY